MTLVLGILLFFILEKLVIWRHCHREECEVHETSGPLILIGDAFHNLVDGIVIAAAFVTSIPLGISTSISVVAHEIPQEVGDFAILIHNKYSRKKSFRTQYCERQYRFGWVGDCLFFPVIRHLLDTVHHGNLRREFHLYSHGRFDPRIE